MATTPRKTTRLPLRLAKISLGGLAYALLGILFEMVMTFGKTGLDGLTLFALTIYCAVIPGLAVFVIAGLAAMIAWLVEQLRR